MVKKIIYCFGSGQNDPSVYPHAKLTIFQRVKNANQLSDNKF